MSFCQPVIERNQVYDQCNFKKLLSFDHMKNTNCHRHKIVKNLKIRFNGEVYEGAWHLSKLKRKILCISFLKHISVLSCEYGT